MNIEELKRLQEVIIKNNKVCNIVGILLFLLGSSLSITIFIQSGIDIFLALFIIFFEVVLLIVIIVIIKSIVNGKNIKIFYKEFKNIFVKNSLQKYFENVSYDYNNGFSEDYIQNIGMIDTGDRFNSNDYISGIYKNIKFEQSDIHIEEKHEEVDKDGNKQEIWKTIFLGRIMAFDFNKNFKANMQVVSSHFYANILTRKSNYVKVSMEDSEFNKMFRVITQNEHDTFYILTPHFMEKIKDITKKLNCDIMFCFVDNRLYVAINNYEDSFEWNVFRKINENEIESIITKDIKLITDFVDELNLDNTLFKEEK